ncbi:MAG: stage III sporulation protein AB [Eubacterium sp.]|jgi:stage III sporulation protein AB|nr:stage III sporulation protein AB [Eubacterium sp.]
MLNIICAVSTVLTGLAWGLYKSSYLKKRAELLSDFILMFRDIDIEIRCRQTPLLNIIENFSERHVFLKNIMEPLRGGGKPETAWAAESEKLYPLTAEDKRIIISVGKSLGKSDTESQTAMLESNRLYLSANLEAARAEYEKKGKMYRSVGVLTGLLAAVIII